MYLSRNYTESHGEKDLGIVVSSDLCPRKQYVEARKWTNRVLGLIAMNGKSKSALVRPHLDYATQFWSPYYRMDIGLPALVLRKVKIMDGMLNFTYKFTLIRER